LQFFFPTIQIHFFEKEEEDRKEKDEREKWDSLAN